MELDLIPSIPEPKPTQSGEDFLAGMETQPAPVEEEKPAPVEEKPGDDLSDLLGGIASNEPSAAEAAKPDLDVNDLLADKSTELTKPEKVPGDEVPMPEPTSVTMAAELGNRAYLRTEWRRNMTEWLSRKEQLEKKTKELQEKSSTVKKLHEDIAKANIELEEKQKEVKKKLERIAVLQARTNNVLNQRVDTTVSRPFLMNTESVSKEKKTHIVGG